MARLQSPAEFIPGAVFWWGRWLLPYRVVSVNRAGTVRAVALTLPGRTENFPRYIYSGARGELFTTEQEAREASAKLHQASSNRLEWHKRRDCTGEWRAIVGNRIYIVVRAWGAAYYRVLYWVGLTPLAPGEFPRVAWNATSGTFPQRFTSGRAAMAFVEAINSF